MGSLAPSGAWAATLVGALATAAGWGWALLLIAWFVASSALTRFGQATKRSRSIGSLGPSSARTALQVAANGGVFVTAALTGTLLGHPAWHLLALGALAAAAADTWATELGMLWGGTPRALIGGGRVEPGMSGGVTAVGLAASVAGAAAVALGAVLLGLTAELQPARLLVAVATAGVAGALSDSVLGALLQARRWCETCERFTERQVHDCAAATRHARGLPWMTNDTVNLLATVVGAVVALAAAGPTLFAR